MDNKKTIFITAEFTNATTDAMLAFNEITSILQNTNKFDLFKHLPDWKHITMEVITTDVTAGTFTIKPVTSNNPDADLSTSSVATLKADASTAFNSGSISGTGKTMVTTSRDASDGSASSNIGAFLGVYIDCSTTCDVSGKVIFAISN